MIRQYGFLFLVPIYLIAIGCTPTPKVKVIQVRTQRVDTLISSTNSGTVEAKTQAILSFGAAGRVSEVNVRAGDKVKRGQVLARLSNQSLQSVFENSSRELQRNQRLRRAGLISQSAYEEVKAKFEIAKSDLQRSVIIAPFDGQITDFNLEVGEAARLSSEREKPPIRIVDLGVRLVRGYIDENDFSKVKVGDPSLLRIPAVRQKSIPAKVHKIVPFVSTNREMERTVLVELEVLEKGLDIPVGASADIDIIVASRLNAKAIPSRTILGSANDRYVLGIQGNQILRRKVKIGLSNYSATEILEGLAVGDIVVLPNDELELKEGLRVLSEATSWP